MELFAGIAATIVTVVGWLVTLRLFRLARHTRGVPEWLLAIALAGLVGVGFPLTAISRAPGLVATIEGSLLFAIGAIGIAVGIGALARFPYLVFRPSRRWGGFASGAILVAGVVGSAGSTFSVLAARSQSQMVIEIGPWAVLLATAIGAAFLWNAIESTLYYRNMKRRLVLGLANPETTHRFLLWSIASAASCVVAGTTIAIRVIGLAILSTLPITILSCGMLVTSVAWWLAFFMPKRYREFVIGPQDEAALHTGTD